MELEHLLDEEGAYEAAQWTFFDSNGQQKARAIIPKDICPQFREEEMLTFAAQMMGHDVPPVSLPNPNWL